MNKFIIKIAESIKLAEDSGDGFLKRQGKHLLTSGVLGSGGALLSNHVALSMRKDMSESGVGKASTLRKMRRDHKLDVTLSPKQAFGKGNGNPFQGTGPSYVHKSLLDSLGMGKGVKKNFVNTDGSKNIGVLAHELGHATSFKNSGKAWNGSQLVSRTGSQLGIGSLVGAGMLSSDKTKDHAWMAPLAEALPTILEEGNANRHAYNAFNKHEGRKVANKFLTKVVSKNMLNYSARPVGAALALAAAAKWIKPRNKDKK